MPSKSNYICAKDQREMMVVKNGVYVEELRGGERNLPYKIWLADLRECPTCGHQILSGFGDRPVVFHGDANYHKYRERVKFTVLDR